ncbi:MAG: acyl-CoA thioesterase [Pseudomonadota bacterium]
MYPFVRLGVEMAVAGLSSPLPLDGTHVSHHVCWPWDIDLFGEMNNGRILTIFDLGRLPLAQRTGLFAALRRRGWSLTMAGATVRYRRRILPFRRVEMRSRCLGRDGRFVYLQQSMWRRGEALSSILYRGAVFSQKGIVPTDEVLTELGQPDWNPALPDWVTTWIAAEDTRPWPPDRG